MIDPATFLGLPREFKNICTIYPPTVNDVVSTKEYNLYVRCLTIDEDDVLESLHDKIDQLDKMPTPFEFMLANCYNNQEYCAFTKAAFRFFIHEEINFFYEEKLIVIGNLAEIIPTLKSFEDLRCIRETDYFDFSNAIREAIGMKPRIALPPPDPNENPRIRRMKEKARYRDHIKEKHGVKGAGISLSTTFASLCCMGIGITPLNIGEMSYASISTLIRTYQEKDKYETDIKSLLAGADKKKVHPKYWIRDLED